METVNVRGIDNVWSTEAQFKHESQNLVDNVYDSAHALAESVNIPPSVWGPWIAHRQPIYDALRNAVEIAAGQPDNYSRLHAVLLLVAYHVQRISADSHAFISSIAVPPYTRYFRTPKTSVIGDTPPPYNRKNPIQFHKKD
jgi:hypothetical protein